MSQPLGLIPFFPQAVSRARGVSSAPAKALGLMSFGVRFDLSANQLDLLRDALLHLPVGCKTSFSVSVCPHFAAVCRDYFSRTDDPAYRLYRNGHLLFSCTNRREFLERFRSVLSLYIAESSRRRTFLRAAVVGWGDRAVVMLGKAATGKTTLLTRLVSAGATYYSDQYAVVDKHGMVYPYACPLEIRDGDRMTLRHIEEFGGLNGCEPLPVAVVLVCRYKPEARWRPRRLTPEAGLPHILDHAVAHSKSPEAPSGPLKHIAANAMIVHGVRGEGARVVDWLTTRIGSPRKIAPQVKLFLEHLRRPAHPELETGDWQ